MQSTPESYADDVQETDEPLVPVSAPASPVMTRALTLVFAVAAGVAVGNLYWAQPLLALIGRDLHVSASTAGLLVTLTQIGYAAGILLIVPLGDVRNRRRLIHTVMLCAAVALILCALVPSFGALLAAITALGLPAKTQLRYPALIASVAHVVRRERTVRWTLVLSATAFGLFTMFWTSLTFLLSAPPFDYSTTVIGLFGLAGLAGAIAAQRAGRLHDRGRSLPATGAAWAIVLVAFLIAGRAGHSAILLLVAIVVLDVAIQGINILNQTRLFALSGDERSRINTAFVTDNFIGGALGSAAAAALWSAGGWGAVTTAAALASCFALVVWAVGRRGPLVVE